MMVSFLFGMAYGDARSVGDTAMEKNQP